MKISLIGYMASGKSFLGAQLAKQLNVKFIDLDLNLEQNHLQMPISDFLAKKGELPFRKIEREALQNIIGKNDEFVLATGGGTPCYYDNMTLLDEMTTTLFLNTSIKTISKRLIANRSGRPLVSHLQDSEINEFVAKHIFERRLFYGKAKLILNEEHHSVQDILKLLANR